MEIKNHYILRSFHENTKPLVSNPSTHVTHINMILVLIQFGNNCVHSFATSYTPKYVTDWCLILFSRVH